ncbi:MAG: hypothetical protein MR278_00440 [Bacteroidales bacterium]|nr:hypothetical protein [Anaerotignum sp.]MCI5678450.1 hypothetical protein [Bacteroidales bacterium]MDY3926575.1 hypothetical protein [Anaerotignum sp.]
MDFFEKPDLEQIRKDRENKAYLRNHYHTRFLIGTTAMVIVGIMCFLNQGKAPEKPEPTQHDLEIAESLATTEGREAFIAEKYSNAKIISESTFGKDIITVFEVGDEHSFCVFEATDTGYWQEYCGNLFPNESLVRGTAFLKDNTFEYDIYLLGSEKYVSLLIDRENIIYPKKFQQEHIYFDDAGFAIMQLDPEIHDSAPRIVAYDAEGNYFILADGTL